MMSTSGSLFSTSCPAEEIVTFPDPASIWPIVTPPARSSTNTSSVAPPPVVMSRFVALISRRSAPLVPTSLPVPATDRSRVPATMSIGPPSVPVIEPDVAVRVAVFAPTLSEPPVNEIPFVELKIAPLTVTVRSSVTLMESAVTVSWLWEAVVLRLTVSVPPSPSMVRAMVGKRLSSALMLMLSLPPAPRMTSPAVGWAKSSSSPKSESIRDTLLPAMPSSVTRMVSAAGLKIIVRVPAINVSVTGSRPS